MAVFTSSAHPTRSTWVLIAE